MKASSIAAVTPATWAPIASATPTDSSAAASWSAGSSAVELLDQPRGVQRGEQRPDDRDAQGAAELAGGVVDRRPDAGPRRRQHLHDRLGGRGADEADARGPSAPSAGRSPRVRRVDRHRGDPERTPRRASPSRRSPRPSCRPAERGSRPAIEDTGDAAATGRMRVPVTRAAYPRTNWKYCVIRKMKPDSAKVLMVTAPLAAQNGGRGTARCRASGERRAVSSRMKNATAAGR